jgi:cytosine/creatinine deaminase
MAATKPSLAVGFVEDARFLGGQLFSYSGRNWLPSYSDLQGDLMKQEANYASMLEIALSEAKLGMAEGGIPVGGAIFDQSGQLIGKGHNRRIQNNDPSTHGETDAFRNAGRQRSYRDLIMVTTLAPCWYCSGLVRQFGFGTVVVGDSKNFQGGVEWLRSFGVKVVDLNSTECISMMAEYIRKNPAIWNEDIGM